MFNDNKASKWAERYLEPDESLLGCWTGSPNPANPMLGGLAPLGLVGASIGLTASVRQKHFLVFITDRRVIFERIHRRLGEPKRTDEMYTWDLADIENLRFESPRALSAPIKTKWMHFVSPSGPVSMLLTGASGDDFGPIYSAAAGRRKKNVGKARKRPNAGRRPCPSCASPVARGWTFCNRCGAALPAA